MFGAISGAAGMLFGFGLAISGLLDPQSIPAFLAFSPGWDPSPGVTFVAASAIAALGYALARRRSAPLFAVRFELPSPTSIDKRLIIGAALFGIGWGVSGICPGAAVAGLAYGKAETFAFLAALVAGLLAVHIGPRQVSALQRILHQSGAGDIVSEPAGDTAAPSLVRRWIVVAAATVGMMSAFSMTSSVAVFMKPFETEFGWLRADIALAYSLLSAGAALGGLVAGRTIDLINTRAIVVFGAVVSSLGFILLSQQDNLVTIQNIYLAIGVFGFSCLYTPLVATVGLWFERSRGLAIGIVTAGGTLGQGVTALVMQPLVESYGWRYTYLTCGIGYLVLLVPAMALVTKPPMREGAKNGTVPQSDREPALPPAVSVGWLGFAATFCCASMAVPVVHLVALLDDRGQSAAMSGGVIITIMLAASAGRIGFGMIADRIGALRSYALAVLVQTLTVFWFTKVQWLPALYVLAVVFGFGYGGVMTALILSVRAVVPARVAGVSTSVVSLLAWGGMALGSFQGGYCFDLTGSYDASFVSAAVAGAANLLVQSGFALHLLWAVRATSDGGGISVWEALPWLQMPGMGRLQAALSRG